MQKHFNLLLLFTALFFNTLIAQTSVDTYYSGTNASNSTFVSDLQTLIRSNYTRISYDQFDETNVTNFASRDTTGGQKVVTCVYSGEQYVYTPPFAWGHFSREHSWCQSWMPTVNVSGFTNRDEYSDQHHIFPVNQNQVNGVRNNHPEGIVVNVTSSYLECKYGTNSSGETVFEPRDVHKGDFARALLYMSVRYNGIGGYDWTFNHLNTVTLPELSEAPQDLNLLIQWCKDDPPSAWEVSRNDYIQSIQGNRNPFVDHPEWVNYINFNDLSILSPAYSTEPSNYITNLSITNIASNSFDVTWTNSVTGSQSPSGYLMEIFSGSNDYFIPIDGSEYTTDTNLADGRGVINITNSGTTSYTVSGLVSGTTYYIHMYSFNGSGTSINYKIDGVVPSANASTVSTGLSTEPSNSVTNLTAVSASNSSITLNWTEAVAGVQAPSGYLIVVNTTGVFSAPTDGTTYADNSNTINISYPSSGTYTFSGLSNGTHYYFQLYSFNGSGSSINYKTDGTIPSANTSTTGIASNDIMITHYSTRYNTASNEYIVLFNNTDSNVDINGYEIAYSSSGGVTSVKKSFTSSTIISSRGYYLLSSDSLVTVGTVSNVIPDATFSAGLADDGQVAFRKSSDKTVIYALATGTITSYSFGQSTSVANPGSPAAFQLTPSGNSYTRTGDNSADYSLTASSSITSVPNSGNTPLPVELNSFIAIVEGNYVRLQWSTATEVNNYGFDIERRMQGDNWIKIGFVQGHFNCNAPNEYSFNDCPIGGTQFQYRLKQIDLDGKTELSNILAVTIQSPAKYSLDQNYPNPFNPVTTIKYSIPKAGRITLKLYDMLGREIKKIVDEQKEQGTHVLKLDASNLASGVYLYQLRAGNYVETKKLILLK